MRKGGTYSYKGVFTFLIVVVSFMVLVLHSADSSASRVSRIYSAKLSSPRSNQLVIHSPDSCEDSTTSTFTVAENTEGTTISMPIEGKPRCLTHGPRAAR